MLNESVIVGVLLLILFGAACLYLYSYVSYVEKKVGMMESIVVDIRMAVDSLMSEDIQNASVGSAIPITSMGGGDGDGFAAAAAAVAPQLVESSEAIPEENFYSSVLEQVHESAAESAAESASAPGVSLEAALQGMESAAGVVSENAATAAPVPTPAPSAAPAAAVGPNLDAMTKSELLELAEQRGVRAKKSQSRSEILGLLRRMTSAQVQPQATGTEDVSGSTESAFAAGAPLDGSIPVDLSDGGANLVDAEEVVA